MLWTPGLRFHGPFLLQTAGSFKPRLRQVKKSIKIMEEQNNTKLPHSVLVGNQLALSTDMKYLYFPFHHIFVIVNYHSACAFIGRLLTVSDEM